MPNYIVRLGARCNGKSQLSQCWFDEWHLPKDKIELPEIQKIVVNENNGYTIVKFENGDVSKVHCNDEVFDAEKAIAMAIAKYAYGNNKLYKAINSATIVSKKEEK